MLRLVLLAVLLAPAAVLASRAQSTAPSEELPSEKLTSEKSTSAQKMAAGRSVSESDAFRVLSFNIRLNTPNDSADAWPRRKDRVADLIRFHEADLVGVQEALRGMLADLDERLPGYAWFGVGRANGQAEGGGSGEFSAIFYRTDRFELLGHDTFWLSETPDAVGSVGWDAALERIATWGRLRDRRTGRVLYHVNTHFDHVGEGARRESARLLRRKIGEIAEDAPAVLTGDFNADDSSAVYRILTSTDRAGAEAVMLRDALGASVAGHYGPLSTWNGFEAIAPGRRIDYVFVSDSVEVLRHGILTDRWGGHFPSDHLPVLAELRLEGAGGSAPAAGAPTGAVPTGAVPSGAFDLQGHRGARGLAPENTVPAFRTALDHGATTLEMDVVVSKDGQVVLSHEPWMSAAICTAPDSAPNTEDEERSHNLYAMTYAEIAQYDCGARGHAGFPEQKAQPAHKPLLDSVLTAAEAYAAERDQAPPRYNIEIKSRPEGDGRFHPAPPEYAQRVYDVLQAHEGVLARSTVQSFDPRALQALRAIDASVALALLVGGSDEGVEAQVARLGFTPATYSPNHEQVDRALVETAHARGMRVIPWTVNDPAAMRALIALGVDGLITDYPDRGRAVLDRR